MTPRIAFRVDASERIGSGHVMRCLTLADALRKQGARPSFVAATLPAELADRIAASGHPLSRIEAVAELDRRGADWDDGPIGGAGQREDAARFLAAAGATADWVIVDHYLLSAPWEQAAGASGAQVAVIDDLANRPHDCLLLLDQTSGRVRGDYQPRVPAHCTLLLGSLYALIRPEFVEARPASLLRRRALRPARRILISLGATDVGGLTLPAAMRALAWDEAVLVDVVIGRSAPSADALEALARAQPRLRLHVDTKQMARLMRDADVAIGAAGSTAWERCCLGLPTLTFVLADNQRVVAERLAEAGAVQIVPDAAALPAALAGLIADPARSLAMSAAAVALVDGHGAQRICAQLLGTEAAGGSPDVEIRPATPDDVEPLWLWRNDPATRRASRMHEPVPWPDHAAWFESSLSRADRHALIAERGGSPIGMVRFDRLGGPVEAYEVGINIRPEARGGGMGLAVLAAGCRHWLDRQGPVRLEAAIHAGNAASRRIFEALGFRQVCGVGEDGFARYVRSQAEPLPDL